MNFFEDAIRWASATVLVIGLLLATAMILKRGRPNRTTENVLAIRHRIALGRGTSIALVEAGKGFVLIGVGADSVNRLKEFDATEAEEIRNTLATTGKGFGAILASLANRQGSRT